jgi:hypothetical protein
MTEAERRASLALSGLVRALHEKKCAAIARFVKRNRGTPCLVALFASDVGKEEEEQQSRHGEYRMYLSYLPFAEDHRDYTFPPIPEKLQPTHDQLHCMDELVEAMDISWDVDEEKRPVDCFNPTLQRFYNSVHTRACDPEAPLPFARVAAQSADATNLKRMATVRALLGRLSALSVSHSKSVLYGAFVWVRRALTSPERRFLARPGSWKPRRTTDWPLTS